MGGTVLGLHVNPNGGVPKHPVASLDITSEGCEGDRQNDLKHHGGPNRAICFIQSEVLDLLRQQGHPISPGSTGENILIVGLPTHEINIGTFITIGQVLAEVTGDAPPCKTIRASFSQGDFKSLSHKITPKQTRWYARVHVEGRIHLGDKVSILNGFEPTGNR